MTAEIGGDDVHIDDMDNGEDMAPPEVNLDGDRVALGPLRRELVETYARWENDFSISAGRGVLPLPVTLDQATETYERMGRDEDTAAFTIYEKPTWRPIGIAWWSEIEHTDGTGTYAIYIAETDARGKGSGTEATRLMLCYAFDGLGLHNVMLIAASFNEAAIRAYTRAGFREFGRRTGSYRSGGRRYDDIYMQCVADEFRRGDASGDG